MLFVLAFVITLLMIIEIYNKGAPEEDNSDDSAVSAEFKTESDKASNFQNSEEGEKGKE